MNDGGPDFLVIGAQKCGTTTLYEDLRAHPAIRIPEKESAWLLDHDVTTADGRAAYGAAFGPRPPGVLVGEVATDYAMLPAIDAVSRARLVSDSLRIIYIVRNPIDRVISHHHHRLSEQQAPANIEDALEQCPDLVDNSRYATQVAPWIDAYGRERVHVVRFEDYVANRQREVGRLHEFLGLDQVPLARPEQAHNVAATKRVAVGRWRSFYRSRLYQRALRRVLPVRVRRFSARLLLPKPPPRPDPPTAETLARLAQELGPEVERLAQLLGTEPWWRLEPPTPEQPAANEKQDR